MALTRRMIRYLALGLVGLAILAGGLLLVLTRTSFGVERAGRVVLERLERSINGSFEVERITSRGLLGGVTLHGVTIVDPDGRPFVRADSARLQYRLRTLLTGSVVFDRITLHGPDVVIERLPGQDRWNYDRILSDPPSAPTPTDTAATADDGEGLVLIRDARIRDGLVTVRIPWDGTDEDTSRLILEPVPGGTARTLRFEGVTVDLPRVVWESPDADGKVIDVEDLATRAFIWDTPADVRELDGTVTIRDSVVTFEADRARLPDSELRLTGQVVVSDAGNRYDLDVRTDRVAFRDLRWLHPPLPTEGGGSLRFRLQTREPGSTLWLAEDAALETGGNQLAGSFGMVTGETLRFTDVDVTATPLDLGFLWSILPDTLPLSGLVIGRIEADGPVTGIRTRGDVRYRTFDDDGNGAESELAWDGVLGTEPPYVLRGMDTELRSVALEQVAHFAPGLRIRGVARGTLRADGALESGVRVSGALSLDQAEQRSAIQGSGWFTLGDTPTFDLQFDAEPVALELLAQQIPELAGLRGEARGPVTVAGSLDDLMVGVDLSTPAGEIVIDGTLGLTGPRQTYRAEGSVTGFQLDRVVTGLPDALVTGRFSVEGSGFDLVDIEGQLSVDLLAATVGEIEFYRGTLRGRVADGIARVDTFSVRTEVGDAGAQGTFGLVESRTGELAVSVRADSLVFLEPVLFADAPVVDVGLDEASRVDGLVTVDGRVAGSIADWRVSGTARVRSLLYDQLEVGRGRLELAWEPDSVHLDASLDSLRYGPRRLSTVRGALDYVAGEGRVTADIRGRRGQRLDVESTFEPEGDVVNLGLHRLQLTTRDGEWVLADTARATVGGVGLQLDSLVLVRGPSYARIRASGVLPWRQQGADEVQEASLAVEVDSVRVGELLRVTQTDTLVDGVVTGRFRVTGTALEPRMRGRIMARSFRYGGAVLDSLRADVDFAAEELDGSFTGWEGGDAIVTGQAHVPVRLALTHQEERWVDRPMDVELRAAGVPAGLLGFLASGFTDLEGRIEGDLALVGTPIEPDLQGALHLSDGAALFRPLAVRYRDVELDARMVEGTVVELEAALATDNGTARVRGTLDLVEPSDPIFDLSVNAQRLDATRRRDVTAIVNGAAQVTGRYTRPVVSGDIRVLRGEMNLDELWRQHQIVQLDTTLFQMLDTTQVSYRPEPENPFLQNLRVTNTTITTERNFWLRSQELNVEVGGELALEVDRQTDDFRLTGSLEVVEGTYQLLARNLPSGRRFTIRDGTIEFVGTPGIDPNLDIEAAYRVRRMQGEPIDVLAQVSGTLQDPRVQLSSNAEVPMSETDLASYILFGRAGAELTQAQLDVAAAGGSLVTGLFRPMVTGAASTGIQGLATTLGLPVDYVALSLPEYGTRWEEVGSSGLDLWRNAQIEVGFDPVENVSVIGSVRIPSEGREDRPSALRLFGARIEYRPWPTWTLEGFIEDQFARTPSFGPAEISDRKVLGLSLFREWGY